MEGNGGITTIVYSFQSTMQNPRRRTSLRLHLLNLQGRPEIHAPTVSQAPRTKAKAKRDRQLTAASPIEQLNFSAQCWMSFWKTWRALRFLILLHRISLRHLWNRHFWTLKKLKLHDKTKVVASPGRWPGRETFSAAAPRYVCVPFKNSMRPTLPWTFPL